METVEAGVGFRLSPHQEVVWRKGGEAARASLACTLRLEGELDAARLRAALEALAGRHEILRTTFERRPGLELPLQMVHETPQVEWGEVSLTAAAGAQHEAEARRLLEAARRQPIDPENGPIIRAAFARLDSRQYLLQIALPALCADAASLRVFVSELFQLYRGAAGAAAEQPLQYADYAAWQRELTQPGDPDAERGREFWEQQAAGAPTAEIPFDGCERIGSAGESVTIPVALDPDRMSRVVHAASGEGISIAAFLLAAWQAMLARLTSTADVSVAYLSAGREHPELAAAIGRFSRAVPVRITIDLDERFRELTRRSAEIATAACAWGDYLPWPEAAAATAAIGFEHQARLAGGEAGGLRFSLVEQHSGDAPAALHLRCSSAGDRWTAELVADGSRVSPETAARIAGYWLRVLDAASAAPETAVGDLSLLSAQEVEQFQRWNGTGAPYPEHRLIHSFFEDEAARVPERIAAVCGEQAWSYDELNRRANQIAHWLRARGIGPDAPVGLCLERSPELLAGLLGILKAGGAYLPLHPDHPRLRLAHQLAEAGATTLVTASGLLDRLPAFDGDSLRLDSDAAELAAQPDANPPAVNEPDHLAYVIYTSGSTGLPKGVAISHRNLVNYTCHMNERLRAHDAEAGLHMALVSAITADLGNTCLFPALTSGGCLHLLPHELAMDGARFAEYAATHPIDVLKITPSHLSALLASDGAERLLPRRALILGGEAASCELARRILRAGRCELINHYGPTETTVGSLTMSVTPDSCMGAGTVPIGRPIANTEARVLDARRKPVPAGTPGELWIGGAGVARGYLNQPELTAERFVPAFPADGLERRFYRTGDRARYRSDGIVEFLGRIDHQIKIRGFRVELGEIEAVLCEYPGVRQSVVIARQDSGDVRLAAYVVPGLGQTPSLESLRGFLSERLPDYMIPAAFVVIGSLPLTPNGKVDREALPAADHAGSRLGAAFVAPRDPMEEEVAAIWAEVLGLERVGVDDDFFALGGHSLLATQIIARMRQRFEVQLPLSSLFEGPTVAAQVAAIRALIGSAPDDREMEQVLEALAGMSDEEIQRFLSDEAPN